MHKEANTMKHALALFLTLTLLFSCAHVQADTLMPILPAYMLPAQEMHFAPDQRFPVYQGPGEDYGRSGNGKATVSTNDWIRAFGTEDHWLFIQYGLTDERTRFGWIDLYDVRDDLTQPPFLDWTWTYSRAVCHEDTFLSDDPFCSLHPICQLPEGTQLVVLYEMPGLCYAETLSPAPLLRGFVPADALSPRPVPIEQDANFVSAYQTLQNAGISAVPCGMYDNDVYFSLEAGGQAAYYYYWDFSRYEIGNWRFTDITDEDAARFIDYHLAILAEVERGDAPEEHLQIDYQDDLGVRNISAVVSNGLMYLETFGRQGLSILLQQLSAHDGNDAINSLRARLASRMLGRLDITPVDPAQGCAWYDALTLAVQDDLPPVDAALYVEDDTLAQVVQALIVLQNQDTYWHSLDVDGEKACNIVYLHAEKMVEKGDRLTVWGAEEYSKYVLYDGKYADDISGHIIPCRIDLIRDQQGAWQIEEVIYAQDGSLYEPSVVDFCDGDRELAARVMQFDTYKTHESFLKYLSANGYDASAVE